MPDEIAVKDTSSIIHIRRLVTRDEQQAVFAKLGVLVDEGKLVFPREVLKELERWANPDTESDDRPLQWARVNSPRATNQNVPLEVVRDVVHKVPRILDPDKPGVEEADPYVLALAIHLQAEGKQVTVLTDERKDRPEKMSMTTACGVLRLTCLPIEAYLEINGIWRRS